MGDFKFDPKSWPDVPAMMTNLTKTYGIDQVMVSTWPFIATGSDTFAEFGSKNWVYDDDFLERGSLNMDHRIFEIHVHEILDLRSRMPSREPELMALLRPDSTPRARAPRSTGTITTAATWAVRPSATSTTRPSKPRGSSTGRTCTRATTSTASRSSGWMRRSRRSRHP